MGLACSLGLPECLKEAEDKFTAWLAQADFDTNRPHPDLRSIIYSYGNFQLIYFKKYENN